MEKLKLENYKMKKGVLVAPFSELPGLRLGNWTYQRLPSFFWFALILKEYDHSDGLEICGKIIKYIHDTHKLEFPLFSEILKLDETQQVDIFMYVNTLVEPKVLYPLTLIFSYSKYPFFAKHFYDTDLNIDRKKVLMELIKDTYDNQSELSSDLRFLIIWSAVVANKVKFMRGLSITEALTNYPYTPHSDDNMRLWRPSVRATELGLQDIIRYDSDFNMVFWKEMSEMTQCELFVFHYEEKENFDEEKLYVDKCKKIAEYYNGLFQNFHPLDSKMEVLISIYGYSYKRMLELVEHNLFNQISGRSIVRNIIENFIMIKYLVLEETNHPNIWKEFVSYGLGQLKLILLKYKDKSRSTPVDSHFNVDYIESILDSETDEKFLNLDTRYFDKKNIREKAISVDEKDLFDFYYDYDSQYEHGLWGAIRESISVSCNTATHQYHHTIDYENKQNLSSVWNDCKKVMDKTIIYLNSIYPLPEKFI